MYRKAYAVALPQIKLIFTQGMFRLKKQDAPPKRLILSIIIPRVVLRVKVIFVKMKLQNNV